MKTAEEIISLLEAQEKALAERLKLLEAQEKGLEQNPDLNKELLSNLRQEIVETFEEKAGIAASKKQIEKGQRIDYDKIRESIGDYTMILSTGMDVVQAFVNPTAMDVVKDIHSVINPPAQEYVISDNTIECKAEILTNPSVNTNTFQEVADIKNKELIDQFEKLDDKIKDAAELSIEIPESKNAAARKWREDIIQKENDLAAKHSSQLKSLDRNKADLEIQMEDAKKFPDSEKKLKALEPINEAIQKESRNINDKFNKKLDEIRIEKEAFGNAMDTTRDMVYEEQQKAIKEQRREFEIEREKERLKEIEGRSGPGS